MSIPKYQEIMLSLLEFATDEKGYSLSETRTFLAENCNILYRGD